MHILTLLAEVYFWSSVFCLSSVSAEHHISRMLPRVQVATSQLPCVNAELVPAEISCRPLPSDAKIIKFPLVIRQNNKINCD